MPGLSQEQILEDIKTMLAMLKDQKYDGPYNFGYNGKWYRVTEMEGGDIMLQELSEGVITYV